jgi:hypothetical protein
MQQEMAVNNQVEVAHADATPVAVRKTRIEVNFRPFLKKTQASNESLEPISGGFSSMSALGIQTAAFDMHSEELADRAPADDTDYLF